MIKLRVQTLIRNSLFFFFLRINFILNIQFNGLSGKSTTPDLQNVLEGNLAKMFMKLLD